MIQKATFAMGCFWKPDLLFEKVKGVKKTRVGYTGCKTNENITYKRVCSGKTGCAEAIEIMFEGDYNDLLNVFWQNHDPTTPNQQGADFGSQYRSIIFYHNPEQKKIALASKRKWQKKFDQPIVTEILKATTFHEAEEYHQKYLKKNKGVC